MKIKLFTENNRITGYQTFPITDDMIEINNLPNDLTSGKYNLVNGQIVEVGYTEEKLNELEEIKLNELRSQRAPLLQAFDKYRSAVTYGIVTETETEHTKIVNWYNSILDLKNLDLELVPEKVKYYL